MVISRINGLDDDGRMYAEPYILPQEPAFAHLRTIELEGRLVELLPDGGGGKPIHVYHALVVLPPLEP